jgi:hypothetical protein
MVRIGRPGWWFKFGEHTAKPTEDHGNRDEANAVRPPDEKLRSPLADPRALHRRLVTGQRIHTSSSTRCFPQLTRVFVFGLT